MQASIQAFNSLHKLFQANDTLLLGVSGGVDSMALLHYLHINEQAVIVAHCNFGLRDKESDKDELLVATFCKEREIPFHVKKFNTLEYSNLHKLSIQEAARALRNNWFETLRKDLNCDSVVTAHHLNDNIETLLFKLSKGTGIKGLRGMLPKNDFLIRPMLSTSRKDIEVYAAAHEVLFRTDSSNLTDKYSRNKIRHNVIPVLQEINPSLENTLKDYFENSRGISELYAFMLEQFKAKLIKKKHGAFYLAKGKIVNYPGWQTLLYELLNQYGLNSSQVNNLIENWKHTETTMYLSVKYRVVLDKRFLIVSEISSVENKVFTIQENTSKLILTHGRLVRIAKKPISKLSSIIKKGEYAYLDADKLQFPLVVRPVQTADYFYPFGMQEGKPKKKKISKLLKDKKSSLLEKEQTFILQSGDKIAWILGHNIDARFSITPTTKNVYQIHLVGVKRKLQ